MAGAIFIPLSMSIGAAAFTSHSSTLVCDLPILVQVVLLLSLTTLILMLIYVAWDMFCDDWFFFKLLLIPIVGIIILSGYLVVVEWINLIRGLFT